MIFPRSLLVALLSAPMVTLAQSNSNPFTLSSSFSATVGKPVDLTWTKTTSGTVSLTLRYGTSTNLAPGTSIAKGIANTGSYTWTPDSSLVQGTYTIEISADADPDTDYNFSHNFVLNSPNKSSSMSSATTSMSTTSSVSSTVTLTSSTSTSTGSSSSSSSQSTSTTSSASTSTSVSPSQSSNSAAAVSTGSPTGGAPRATAMAGLLGVVALGAMAL